MESQCLVACTAGLEDDVLFSLTWLCVPLLAVLLAVAGILIYKLKIRTHNIFGDNLRNHVLEVHRISGDVTASMESIKRCIMLLNHLSSSINHPMPPYCYTPFLRACWSGHTPLVRYMLKNGADLQSCTSRKETAMFLAAYRVIKTKTWNSSVLDLLHSAGCELSVPDNKGSTALHLAARAGHVSLTYWLLSHGAHHTLLNCYPTPYCVTKKYKDTRHKCIAALLHSFCPQMAVFYYERKNKAIQSSHLKLKL